MVDVPEHGADVGGGVVAPGGFADRGELQVGPGAGFAKGELTEGAADPLRHGEPVAAGDASQVAVFGVTEDDLEAFTHDMSMMYC